MVQSAAVLDPQVSPRGRLVWPALCLLSGALQAAALALPGATWAAPMGGLQLLAMAMLVWALQRANTPRQALWCALLFSTAWLAATFWWLVVSMHRYGGMPLPAAVVSMLALAFLLGLYSSAAGWAWRRWASPEQRPWRAVGGWAALWTLAELARGQWLTGFPWGAVGYAHGEHLAGWAPWVGVYGVTTLVCALAAAAGLGMQRLSQRRPEGLRWLLGAGLAYGLAWGLSAPLQQAALAHTHSSGAMQVRLLQGNIAQDEKFQPGTGMATALAWYPEQVAQAWAHAPRPNLVVAPETALPVLPQQLDDAFWQTLLQGVAETALGAQDKGDGSALLLGLPLGSFEAGYTNSAWGITAPHAEAALRTAGAASALEAVQTAPFYRYDKHHLVPFGEFIPPLFRWFTELMQIPLGDFGRGALVQPAWHWAGQRIATHICYEDLFGEELAAQFAQPDAPTVLINLSNIAWFGNTVAIDQHLQIARWRAMELGRPVVRATNTGATVVIDHTGVVQASLPRHTRGTLDAVVYGRDGLTPYARWASRWGQWPLWLVSLWLLLWAAWPGLRRVGVARP